MIPVTLTCSRCRRPLTWASGRALCGNASCAGHCPAQDVEAERRRDLDLERATLEAAATVVPVPVAGGSPFVAEAVARLALGERQYGDRWSRLPVASLLAEIGEEAADVGCWSVLALQALDELDTDQREHVEACLLDAARAGARAHDAVMRALRAVPPAGRDSGSRV